VASLDAAPGVEAASDGSSADRSGAVTTGFSSVVRPAGDRFTTVAGSTGEAGFGRRAAVASTGEEPDPGSGTTGVVVPLSPCAFTVDPLEPFDPLDPLGAFAGSAAFDGSTSGDASGTGSGGTSGDEGLPAIGAAGLAAAGGRRDPGGGGVGGAGGAAVRGRAGAPDPDGLRLLWTGCSWSVGVAVAGGTTAAAGVAADTTRDGSWCRGLLRVTSRARPSIRRTPVRTRPSGLTRTFASASSAVVSSWPRVRPTPTVTKVPPATRETTAASV